MKINIKAGGKTHKVEFKFIPQLKNKGLIAMAKRSKELDALQLAIADRAGGDELIDYIILKELDKKLKLPVEIDHSYDGAGYGFVFDFYTIAKKLN
jgi:hypothetical protein